MGERRIRGLGEVNEGLVDGIDGYCVGTWCATMCTDGLQVLHTCLGGTLGKEVYTQPWYQCGCPNNCG